MKHPRRVLAGVAALVLAGTAGVVAAGWSDDSGSPPGGTAVAAEAARTGLSDEQKVARKREVDVVLARRATAVLKGDLAGFLAAVDPKQPALVARQRLLFVNLRKFGFSTLKYFAADDWNAPNLVDKYGPTTYTARVMMRYQIAGLDPKPVQTDLGYTFVRRAGGWTLVEDGAIDEVLSRDGHRQPWDYEEVALVRRGRVVVVVDKKEAELGKRIARVSSGAVAAVRRHWQHPWNGAVLVVAMPDTRVMATIWTAGSGQGWTIAAKAVTLFENEQMGKPRGAPVGSRIVVNPAMRKGLEEDLLVHEMTHVASVPIGVRTPTWLVEGLAEYVRTRSIEDDPQWTVDPYRRVVRTKYLRTMKTLPSPSLFDVDADRAYGLSWWVVEYLADAKGAKSLVPLYTDLARHNTTPAAYTTIIKKHTGKTPAQLTAAVKKFKG
ncbi:hypothetical protein EV643_11390 [Kribbella sp. VKM Ac-2527]|uniref:Basic secretory peptidase family protein n=1 Tax=Kribbella caucasensis TaxID=2512215 RepID=A0A4R6K717_9ACTN|nr:hypothetical protein [Kribbella sp. VKM Ac-2527]TDO45317.1 hypothetical protein EV643_11390 [Kribbella sp. VKM Ac-2527]